MPGTTDGDELDATLSNSGQLADSTALPIMACRTKQRKETAHASKPEA